MIATESERDTLETLLEPERRGRSVAHQTWRARIVDVVVEVVAGEGVAAVSFAAIAARADTSKSTVAYHFDSREELLASTLRTVYARAVQVVTDAVVAETSGTGRLRAYIAANLTHLRSHRSEMAALLALRVGPSPEIRDLGSRISDAVLDVLTELVDAARAERDDVPDAQALPSREIALSLRGSIDAAAIALARDPDAVDLDRYARTLQSLYLPAAAPRSR